MNKKTFLTTLDEKLAVLTEEERKDLLNEYENTINEKIKNGQTEKEAVKDFGDIDELVKEIYSAYKINSNFEKESSFLVKLETGIRSLANKLADFTKNTGKKFKASNKEITLSLVFEILIKLLLFILIIIIMKVPCELLGNLGSKMLGTFISPLGDILSILWYLLMVVAYFSLIILVAISMFKQYFNKEVIMEEKKEEVKQTKGIIKEKNPSALTNVLILILKLALLFMVIIPVGFVDLGCLTGLVVSIAFWIEGINLVGPVLFMLGASLLFVHFTIIMFYIIFTNKKIIVWPFLVAFILMVIGGVTSVVTILNIDYKDVAPMSQTPVTETYSLNVSDLTYLDIHGSRIDQEVDNTLEDGLVIIDLTYYKDYASVQKDEYVNNDNEMSGRHISYHLTDKEELDNANNIYKLVMNNLKNNEFYNYHKLFEADIKIKANEKTLQNIKINH